MNKIKLLVIPSDQYGIGFYRFSEPHINILKQFADDIDIEINQYADFNDFQYISKFNIIFGHKEMCSAEKAIELFPKLREKGIKIVMDIDDYFHLPQGHPSYAYSKQIKYSERIIEMLKLVDYVTTTTDYFASQIKQYNKNVVVFPNAVDPNWKGFQIKDEKSERVRLQYLCGSSHLEDIKLLKPMYQSLNDKYQDKLQTVICGFDTRGMMQIQNENGQMQQRPIEPKETCWYEYEKIATSDYKYIDKDYNNFLMKFKNEEYVDIQSKSYRRVWTKSVRSYSSNYNLGDITLAPLVINSFNKAKSNLKVIESGFFKKPIIASDIEPYQIDIKHGWNGFLVKNNSGTKDWAYYAKKLIDDPILRKEMGENLYETVKDKYNINNVSSDRFEWYKKILK